LGAAVTPKELFDQPDASGAVDALDVELDPFHSGFASAIRFDELEPLVIDSAGFHVRRR
jgi:hypothetical protein